MLAANHIGMLDAALDASDSKSSSVQEKSNICQGFSVSVFLKWLLSTYIVQILSWSSSTLFKVCSKPPKSPQNLEPVRRHMNPHLTAQNLHLDLELEGKSFSLPCPYRFYTSSHLVEPVLNYRLWLTPVLINYSQTVPALVKIKEIWLSSTLFRLDDIWNTRSHIWWEFRGQREQRSWSCSDCPFNTSEAPWIVTAISDRTGRAANSNTAIHHPGKHNCWPHFWFPALTKQLGCCKSLTAGLIWEGPKTKHYHTSRPGPRHESELLGFIK